MKRTFAVIAIVVAAGLLALGMIFLCAAVQELARLLIAAPLILVGGALAAWGALTLRRTRDLDPEHLSDRMTQLARVSQGELTLSRAVAELNVPDEAALAAFNLLERRGQAHRERVGEQAQPVYVFPGLRPRKVERRCPYCGAEFSVKEAVYQCPNCGGDLRLERSS